MTDFPRDFFLNDPTFKQLFQVLKQNHKIAGHTEKNLSENKHIEGFCEEATHFAILPGKDPVYVSYDVTTQLRDGRASVTFDKITVYDNVMEYNATRMNGMYAKNYTEHELKGPVKG